MAELPDDIARINALTTNARNTWFALLGVLVFVGITLMGVEHIDFYGVDRATKLPLVDVEVPTRYFFIAAPILTAAIYGYFHLYLIRLWDALSDADAQYDGRPLGDVIAPWLVTDAALQLRRKWRDEYSPCNAHRTMETPAMWLNIALAWIFGLVVLALIWWQSMPARDLVITGIAAVSLLASLVIGLASYVMLSRRMLRKRRGPPDLHRSVGFVTCLLFTAAFVLPLSWLRTTGNYTQNPKALAAIAPIVMINEAIVERPHDWLEHEFARKDYRAKWCTREEIEDCHNLVEKEDDFSREWQNRRDGTLASLRRPDWHGVGRKKPDFRQADLRGAFLAGANLMETQLDGSVLIEAQLEGTNLRRAILKNSDLRGAQLQGGDLSFAQMQGADFRGAQLQGADLRWAQMQGADLSIAQMEGADLRGAQMQGTDLIRAELDGAMLDYAFLSGRNGGAKLLLDTNLVRTSFEGAALRFVFFANTKFNEETDFRNTFLDGSVHLPNKFRAQMGAPLSKPCQWIDDKLSDDAFHSYWRWWLEKKRGLPWRKIAPPEWRDVPLPTRDQLAKYNLTDCHWKTGPMTGTGD